MMDAVEALATRWISRSAAPTQAALDAAATLQPAVVVTGGSSGIGFALAREFARRSPVVVLIGRNAERLAAAAQSLSSAGAARIDILPLDVGEPDAPSVLAAWLAERRFYCDVLVNNAALGQAGAFAQSDIDGLDKLLATNVAGVARLTRAMLPGMIARGRGGLLTVASLGGLIPGPYQAAYYASKAFAISLSEAIASETAGRGVRVTVILPGPVETRFHARMGAEGALYRHLISAAAPERVARLAMRAFRLGRRVAAPGLVPMIAIVALRVLPHAIVVPVTKFLLATGRD